jgi:hypothetical protein
MRELVSAAVDRLERIGPQRLEQGHAKAFTGALTAVVAMEDGDLMAAATALDAALPVAVGTTDMPIVAQVGTVAAALSLRAGHAEDAAEQLGACVVLRGAEDRSNPEVRRLLEALEGHEAAYGRGRGLDRDAAIARLASRAPAVRP